MKCFFMEAKSEADVYRCLRKYGLRTTRGWLETVKYPVVVGWEDSCDILCYFLNADLAGVREWIAEQTDDWKDATEVVGGKDIEGVAEQILKM